MKPKILVPFDFSDTAERALAWATDLQRTTNAPALQLLHGITSRPAETGNVAAAVLLPNADEIATLEAKMIEKARAYEATATAGVGLRRASCPVVTVRADHAK